MLSKYWALSCKGIGSTVDADTFMVLFDDLGKQHDVRFDGTIKRGTLGTIAEFVLDGKKMIAKTVPAVDWCMENLRKEYAILSFLYGNELDISLQSCSRKFFLIMDYLFPIETKPSLETMIDILLDLNRRLHDFPEMEKVNMQIAEMMHISHMGLAELSQRGFLDEGG